MTQSSFNSFQASLERALPALLARLGGRRLPSLVFLALVVLVAWLAARLSWQFAAPPGVSRSSAAPATNVGTGNARSATSPVARITAAHLFGTANAPSRSAAVANAPKTSLDLTLLGVAAGGQNFPSQAIIANGSNKNQHTYAIGASLPGGAVVHDIFADRVVIAHDGRLESLSLPQPGTSILSAHMQFGNGTGNASHITHQSNRPTSFISHRLRNQIESHPQSLSNYMRMRPYSANGKLVGYRVYPGKQPALFEHSGLKPGDVVTRINGISLDSGKGAMEAMALLSHAHGSVRLDVKRHGKPVHITLNLPGS